MTKFSFQDLQVLTYLFTLYVIYENVKQTKNQAFFLIFAHLFMSEPSPVFFYSRLFLKLYLRKHCLKPWELKVISREYYYVLYFDKKTHACVTCSHNLSEMGGSKRKRKLYNRGFREVHMQMRNLLCCAEIDFPWVYH